MPAAYLNSPGQHGFIPRGCSKLCFASQNDAVRQLKTMGAQPGRGHLSVYLCRCCDAWHIGHRRGKKP
jgi:hypothetical protein